MYRLFTPPNFGLIDLKNMNYSQVDLSHLGQIVVNQPNTTFFEICLKKDLLFDFAAHRLAVDAGGVLIDRGDVPADAERALAEQSRLALALPAAVREDLAVAHKDAVGDQLLEAGVLFDLISGAVAGVGGIEQRVEVGSCIGLEALKVTDFVEQRGGNDEDVFHGLRGGRHARGLCVKG